MAVRSPLEGVVWGTNLVGMPGAVAPSAPSRPSTPATFADQPGAAAAIKKRKKKGKQQQSQQPTTTTTTTAATAPAASDGKTAAERRREAAKKRAERQKAAQAAREEARRNRFNPLATPFKSPAELRAEAIRLAELGSPTEASLREQQAREESGLTGLTGALTSALGGVRTAQEAGLQGLGSLYQSIAGGAQQAGQSAAAAAGVGPSTMAAGATPVAVQAFPVLGAAIRGYESVAPVVGAQLVGGSRAGLSKALAERASRISSDTAKYLQQLQGIEYEKAVAQETARQNAARLGLSAEEMQFEQALAGEKLGLEREKVAQGWYRAETSRINAMKTGNKRTDLKSAKNEILKNLTEWTSSKSGANEYDVTVDSITGPKSVKIQAASPDAAVAAAVSRYPQTFNRGTPYATYVGPVASAGRAPESEWRPAMINLLMANGATRAEAQAFIKNRVLPSLGR